MKEEINAELFDHLVGLAALALSQEEAEYLRRELNNQLAAIHTLESIPLPEGIEPAARGVPYPPERSQPLREDVVEGCEQVAEILAQAPEFEDGYIVVPEIPHEDL